MSSDKELSSDADDLLKEGQEIEERVLRYIDKVGPTLPFYQPSTVGAYTQIEMLMEGKNSIITGFMWVFRSMANPQRIKLPEDEK